MEEKKRRYEVDGGGGGKHNDDAGLNGVVEAAPAAYTRAAVAYCSVSSRFRRMNVLEMLAEGKLWR